MLLQTKPAHVVRGAEARLEDGLGKWDFQAGTMHLATLLAREPQLQAQIHLQDSRCRAAPCEHLLPAPQIVGESCALLPPAGAAPLSHAPRAAGPATRPWGAQTSPCHHCCRRAACRAQPLCSSKMPSANRRDPRQALLRDMVTSNAWSDDAIVADNVSTLQHRYNDRYHAGSFSS